MSVRTRSIPAPMDSPAGGRKWRAKMESTWRIGGYIIDLHWLPVSQRVVFKTAWKSVHGVAPSYLVTSAYPILPFQVVSICDVQQLTLYWFYAPGLQLDNEVSQSTDQPHGTVCHQHYGLYGYRSYRTCQRAPQAFT